MARPGPLSALLMIPLIAILVQGCSVGMALSGSEDPDLTALRKGAPRSEVELHLGPPIASKPQADGRHIDTYEYEIGDEPSPGRAVAHGVLNVVTFGLWDIAGVSIEGLQGDMFHSTVTYDQNDRVADIATLKLEREKTVYPGDGQTTNGNTR